MTKKATEETPRNWGRWLLLGGAAIALASIGYAVVTRPQGRETEQAGAPSANASAATDTESLIRSLQERVGANPKDAEGWQQLGWLYFETGRYDEAARAYRRATELSPQNATFWSSLGESIAMASEHDPMPAAASDAFEKAIRLDPKEPRARYFLAVKKDLGGDHKGAINDWLALLADTPPGAPWEKDLRRTIEQVGTINKIDVASRLGAIKQTEAHPAIGAPMPVATAAIPGPTREQMQAAAALPKGQQDQMIEGMVSGLEAKLKARPGNIEGWVMLMRSRMTLGETAKASAALKSAIDANPGQEKRLRDEARLIAVPGA